MRCLRHILVVEPERSDADNLRRRLGQLGVTATMASTALEALQVLRQHIFDGAIVAAEMEIGGELLLSRLSRLPSTSHLLATGPPGDLEIEACARSAGACAYLPRPVQTQTLAMTLGLSESFDMARAP